MKIPAELVDFLSFIDEETLLQVPTDLMERLIYMSEKKEWDKVHQAGYYLRNFPLLREEIERLERLK